jgi:acyl dehydratase
VRTFNHLDELRAVAGQPVTTSDWLSITQERINAFADATGDHQWIHVDAARAQDSPFGTTIAHGFLTLSLVSALMRSAVSVAGLQMTINYGLNRVRFVSPVPAGSRVRAHIALAEVADVRDSVQATWHVTIELEGSDKPCLAADWLVRYYPGAATPSGREA